METIWDNYLKQTTLTNPKQISRYKYITNKFIAWLKKKNVKTEDDISEQIQKEYLNHLLTEKGVSQKKHIKVIKQIFRFSKINIFQNIKVPAYRQISHDIYNEQEIALLKEKATGNIKDIIMTSLYTGLRKKDICLLKKSQVKLENWIITLTIYKTKKEITIPILTPLKEYISCAIKKSKDEYVYPNLARQYLKNPDRITAQFIYFLQKNGIKDIREYDPKRKYSANRKGIHSLRHTFAYIVGKSQIPVYILQATLGHSSPKMTELYMKHVTEEDKRKCLEKINSIIP